ncbi:MAG: lipoyl(octanoyl) transferase LipB [Verrucomicrobiae bacterium]|nr:lipoyl(octanoyl) transferase LipB [Verrucomicrobiae bacterium]MCP5539364.1 lipoyl(octanoyl) transferase LipB [Akkermansiaceae bacterium]MCP5549749.1 lipoyl(octanoyl) transferase LipB [Akkermansiaceae bacterium]
MAPDFRWLGRLPYGEALALQDELAARRASGDIGDRVLFLEHEPVYTIGRTRDRSSLGRAGLPHPVVEINRGGQATYHGPGQLVGYPILDLQRRGSDLHAYLRALETALIDFLRTAGVDAGRREGLTGVWVEGRRKIASIGVGARRWVSMHGFALNVSRDLAGFEAIVPCGIAGVEMTSLEIETDRAWEVEETARLLQPWLAAAFSRLASPAPSSPAR